jgi:hypothetical protein
MQQVHTAALPPNQGRILFEISGCTWNNKNALMKIVAAYAMVIQRSRLEVGMTRTCLIHNY